MRFREMSMVQSDGSGKSRWLYDPTGVVKTLDRGLAPRLATLDGKVMGIVDDGAGNTHLLLESLADEIAKQYSVRRLPAVVKPSLSSPLPDEAFAAMLTEVDFVLVGVGI
jgi:hypothetical protein